MKKLVIVIFCLLALCVLPWWFAKNALTSQLTLFQQQLELERIRLDYNALSLNLLTPKISLSQVTLGDGIDADALSVGAVSLTGYNFIQVPQSLSFSLNEVMLNGAVGEIFLGPLKAHPSALKSHIQFDLVNQTAQLEVAVTTNDVVGLKAELKLAQTNALYAVLSRYHQAYRDYGELHLMPLSEQLALESEKITALSVVEPQLLTLEIVDNGKLNTLFEYWAQANKLTLAQFKDLLIEQVHALPLTVALQQTIVESLTLPTTSLSLHASLAEGTRVLDLQSPKTLASFSDPNKWVELFNVRLARQSPDYSKQ